ncbi:12756_t:CDS:2, partial [Dentiscutata heterogama]
MDWLKIAIQQKYIKLFKYDSFRNLKEIGKGGFGTVYSAYSENIDNLVALKALHYSPTKDNKISLDGFIKEVKNMNSVNHHVNVIRFFGITQDEIALSVIFGTRETPINGTPVDFMNIYCGAWNDNPELRPTIAEIRNKLDCININLAYCNEQDINTARNNDYDNNSLELFNQSQ